MQLKVTRFTKAHLKPVSFAFCCGAHLQWGSWQHDGTSLADWKSARRGQVGEWHPDPVWPRAGRTLYRRNWHQRTSWTTGWNRDCPEICLLPASPQEWSESIRGKEDQKSVMFIFKPFTSKHAVQHSRVTLQSELLFSSFKWSFSWPTLSTFILLKDACNSLKLWMYSCSNLAWNLTFLRLMQPGKSKSMNWQ